MIDRSHGLPVTRQARERFGASERVLSLVAQVR